MMSKRVSASEQGQLQGALNSPFGISGHDIYTSLHRCLFLCSGPGMGGEVTWRGLLDAGGVADGDAMDCMECYW